MSIYIPVNGEKKKVKSIFADVPKNEIDEFHLFGKAKQQTTSGNQLFDISTDGSQCIGNYYVNDKNYNYSLSDNANHLAYRVKVESGKKYIFSTTNNSMQMTTRFEDAEKVLVGAIDYKEMKNAPFAIPEKVEYIVFCLSITNVNTHKYQLELGEVATPYELYTGGQPSPSPEFPQEIVVPSGEVKVKSCGKNLLPYPYYDNFTSSHGVTFIKNEDNSLTANGTSVDYSGEDMFSFNFAIEDTLITKLKNKKIIVSSKGITSSDISYVVFLLFDENKTIIKRIDLVKGWESVSLDVPDNAAYMNFAWYIRTNVTVNNVTVYPMIRLASDTDSTYEPYKETTATIPVTDFAGIPVASGGNYTDSNGQQWICDEIVKYADGSGEKIQRVGKVVYDGSDDETWLIYTTDDGGKQFQSTIPNNGSRSFLCTHFRESGVIYWALVPNLTYMVHPTEFENFRFRYDACITVEEWKTWLEENHVIVWHELAEPIHTLLTAEELAEIEKLQAFDSVTHFSNDADCGMDVTISTHHYTKKIKSIFGNVNGEKVKLFEEGGANCYYLTSPHASNEYSYSNDSVAWTEKEAEAINADSLGTALINITYNHMCFGNGRFVAVGQKLPSIYSLDGKTWNLGTVVDSASSCNDICFAFDKFWVACGSSLYCSLDGITWTLEKTINMTTINCIRYMNGIMIAAGAVYLNSVYYPRYAYFTPTSDVAIRWSSQMGGIYIYSVAYANGIYVFGANSGKILYSTAEEMTLLEGTKNTSDTSTRIVDIVHDGEYFRAFPGNTGSFYWRSSDGKTWTKVTITRYNGSGFDEVKYINGKYYAVQYNNLYVSDDASSWDMLIDSATCRVGAFDYGEIS